MIYRPAYKGTWKQLSIFIIVAISIIVLIIFFQIFIQHQRRDDIRLDKANGILIEKKDLRRGNFLIVLKEGSFKKELSIAGYDLFFAKLEIGDSLSKQLNTYFFDVYRKTDSIYQFQFTIGYE